MDLDTSKNNKPYQVLARKHRPVSFSDLIGQETMVRIIKNSFISNKIAHAFMLTGVRGVGKTTTARIIAKGLNCIGVDGLGGPSTEPCGSCDNCMSISQGNHVDVLEIDAASRTGVSDIRELIDSVFYRAASARYKVYVIDEVHMLSTSAFNALLKTLEEPPEHVKFIFATTEIQKVPATVLSRCQKFDLRRIEPEVMVLFLKGIAEKENFQIDESSLGLITRASEGSVRDALSLLEQVVIDNDGGIQIEKVRLMLGLSDRGRNIDLLELIFNGQVLKALELFNSIYRDGADIIILIKDLSEIVHWITTLKISPELANDNTLIADERDRGLKLSEQLNMRILSRMWQLLLKLLEEMSIAPNVKIAAEMGIIRLTHISDLPSPDELLKLIKEKQGSESLVTSKTNTTPEKKNTEQISDNKLEKFIDKQNQSGLAEKKINPAENEDPSTNLAFQNKELEAFNFLSDFNDVIELIRAKRNVDLLIEIEDNLRLVTYQIGRIEIQVTAIASSDLASRLALFLKENTGERWVISIVSSGGAKTIKELKEKKNHDRKIESNDNPLIAKILSTFPGSKITSIVDSNRNIGMNRDERKTEEKSFNIEWEPLEKE
jgi:DNA polymerase-3 subunit gamma/tau